MTGKRSRRLTAENAGPGPLAGGVQRLAGRHRDIRLTADQAGRLASTLSELAGGLEDAGDGAARYRPLIGLYHASPARPARIRSNGSDLAVRG